MIFLIDKVKSAITTYNMITQNDSILIGLSGGADSVALLYSMIELQKDYNLSISSVHINHQLRGEEIDGDEEFCRPLCNKCNIAFYC